MEKYIITTDYKVVPHCSIHVEKELELYCETCQQLICLYCTIKQHNGHNYDLIVDVYPKYKEELLSSLEPIKERINQEVTFNEKERKVKNEVSMLKEDIDREIDQLHQQLDQRKEQLIGKLHMVTKEYLEKEKCRLDNDEKQIADIFSKVESLIETDIPVQILENKASIHQEIQELLSKPILAKPHLSLNRGRSKHFKKALNSIQINESNQIENSENESSQPNESLSTVCQLKRKARSDSAHNTPETGYRPPKRTKSVHSVLLSIETERETFDLIKGLKGPWKIASNSKGHVIVAEKDADRVSVYTTSGKQVVTFGGRGSKEGEFYCPVGVAVDNEDNIYITEFGGNRIQKFSPNGKFLLSAGTLGRKALQFDGPEGVSYNRQNQKIYVCDRSNCRIQVLTKDLTFYKEFGKNGRNEGELDKPSGIDIDAKGDVYIADTCNDRIQVFTSEGVFVKQFGTNDLSEPTDISISQIGNVYITTNKMYMNHPISKFNNEGMYIQGFGKKGIQRGFFKNGQATGIATNDMGVIFVSDLGNNRVQILNC